LLLVGIERTERDALQRAGVGLPDRLDPLFEQLVLEIRSAPSGPPPEPRIVKWALGRLESTRCSSRTPVTEGKPLAS